MIVNKPYKKIFLKLFLGLGFLFTFFNLYAQDKVVIFFESGSSKIDESQEKKLKNIPSKFNLAELDSAWFIGKADSLGKLKANIKLSVKRAKNIANYCKDILPDSVPIRIYGIGEKQKQIEYKDRSVTIVLFLKPVAVEEKTVLNDTIFSIKGCYNIDYYLLQRAHFRYITKNKKKFVLIEIAPEDFPSNCKRSFYSSTTDSDSEIIPKPLKWVVKTTGNDWWKKSRYQTTVEKSVFDKYKIFWVSNEPCDDCSINFRKDSFPDRESKAIIDSCLMEDKFLMDNVQIKRMLFRRRYLKLRAPIEYVDIKSSYFLDFDRDKKITWKLETKRRNKNYYVAKIPIYKKSYRDQYFYSFSKMNMCCYVPTLQNYTQNRLGCCLCYFTASIKINIEIGNNHFQKINIPYAGILFESNGPYFNKDLLIGIDSSKNLYTRIRLQFNFITTGFSVFNPFTNWQSPKMLYQNPFTVFRMYVGSELRRGKIEDKGVFFEHFWHTGFSFNFGENYRIRAFAQYGMGYDFNKIISNKSYPILQTGMIIHF